MSGFDTQLQDKLLKLFKVLVDFFEKNGLHYNAAFGTCLGAVRHNGFIPWDDDIDINMPREDYDRFLSMAEQFKGSGYELLSLNDTGYYCTFAKFCDTTTTVWERRKFPRVIGLFIDIFPIDETGITEIEFEKARALYVDALNDYRCSITKTSLSEYMLLAQTLSIRTLLNRLACDLYYTHRRRYYHDRLIAAQERFHSPGSMIISDAYPLRYADVMPKEWFMETIMVPFGNIKVRIPAQYDLYLKQFYGDYMSLPPIEQRVQHHNEYYINLSERLEIHEIKRRTKKGIYREL